MGESDRRMDQRVRTSMRELVRESFVTGLAVVVPPLIAAIVLAIALQYVHGHPSLFARAVIPAGNRIVIPVSGDTTASHLVLEMLTPPILLWVIPFVGLFTDTTHWGERAVNHLDYFISRVAAGGGVDESFRQTSDVGLECDTAEPADYVPTGPEDRR